MSSATRTAVFKAIRYQPEHRPSELFYVLLIAYLLYAREPEDIVGVAFPIFIVLVICYQVVGLIVKLSWDRQLPDQWDITYWTGATTIFSASYVLIMYGLIAFAIDCWHEVNLLWSAFDPNNQNQFAIVVGLTVLICGGLLYWFRLRQRFLYGFTEAIAGISVGIHRVSIEQWTGVPTNSGFYLALLTAGIYLVVRGIDNMHQAHLSGDPTIQRLFRRLTHVQPTIKKVARPRIPSLRSARIHRATLARASIAVRGTNKNWRLGTSSRRSPEDSP